MNTGIKRLTGLVLFGACAWANSADTLQLRSMAASCAACHGSSDVAQPSMGKLAGVAKEELLKKLLDFKTGKQPATLMHQLSRGYSDQQLEQLASYFSALKK